MPLVAHPVRSLWGSQPRCARCVCEWLHRKWDGASFLEPLLPVTSRWILCLFLISERCFQFDLFIEALYNLHNLVALCYNGIQAKGYFQHLSLRYCPAASTHSQSVPGLKYWRWTLPNWLTASPCDYWPHTWLDPCGALNL